MGHETEVVFAYQNYDLLHSFALGIQPPLDHTTAREILGVEQAPATVSQ